MNEQTRKLLMWQEHEERWAPLGLEAAKTALKPKPKPKLVYVMRHGFEKGVTEEKIDAKWAKKGDVK
jgi:hypothetical protein